MLALLPVQLPQEIDPSNDEEQSCFTCVYCDPPPMCRQLTFDEDTDWPVIEYCEESGCNKEWNTSSMPIDRTIRCPKWGPK